jgi:hypothetical protein
VYLQHGYDIDNRGWFKIFEYSVERIKQIGRFYNIQTLNAEHVKDSLREKPVRPNVNGLGAIKQWLR